MKHLIFPVAEKVKSLFPSRSMSIGMQPKEFHCTDKGGSNLVQRTSAWLFQVRLVANAMAKRTVFLAIFNPVLISLIFLP